MKILYVEDDPVDVDLLQRSLAGATLAHSLAVAPTLAAARLHLADAPAFDLVLTDIQLPDGTGLDLVREIRERALPVAVVALTGQGDEALAVAALKAGADDYLSKSGLYSQRLQATLKAALERFRRDQSRQRRGLRLLYGEHHAADADLTCRHLEQHAPHIRVEVVADSAAVQARLAADALAAQPFDLLLLDFRLTPESGLELLKQLREDLELDLPVVIVTGQGSEDVAVEAMRLGATDYLVKHPDYLHGLPHALESAFHRVVVEREQQRLATLNAELESRVEQRTADLALARDEAERANRAKSEFLSGMSHELRTPMNAVLGFSQLLLADEAHPLTDQQQRYVGRIHLAGTHLLGLIDEVLDLSRIESGRSKVDWQTLDLAALVGECLLLLEATAQAQGIVLEPMVCVGRGFDVHADPMRAKQVLLNLLGNAIKYNRAGGRVGTRLQVLGAQVQVDIADTGPGLSAEQRSRLFKDYERLDADKTAVPGSGLGLALSQRLAGLMNGELGVHSEVGVGSTFWLRLARPRAAATDGVAAVAAGLAQQAAAGPVGRVVYIEDNPVNIELMEAFLAALPGVALQSVEQPRIGLAVVTRELPDLVLLDLEMPDLSGYDVLRELRRHEPTRAIPVIAVSAHALASDVERGLAAGFDAYLTKPVDRATMCAAVAKALLKPAS